MADYTIDLNGSQSTIGNVWKNLYLSLSACNQTISLLPSEVLTEAENKSFEGQAKFWRAFYLWLITETWGERIWYPPVFLVFLGVEFLPWVNF